MSKADILAPLDPDLSKLHPGFVALATSPGFAPARPLIRDVWDAYVDRDGNFVEQFQTTGFDARIWELFLFAFLNDDAQSSFNWDFPTPDFLIEIDGIQLGVEAVTANPSQLADIVVHEATVQDPEEQLHHLYPIRLGSALYSKLSRRYWELPQLVGKPIVLAIQDFHEPGSLYHSSASLWQYLYGIKANWYHDSEGRLHIEEIPVEEHVRGRKSVPSGFFQLPDAENVSAVLFGNSGTVAKFNRMGYRLGYGREDVVTILWRGLRYNHEADSDVPMGFLYELGADGVPDEQWGQGLILFHNPNARFPLPHDILGCGYGFVDDTDLRAFLPEFHPFASQTVTIIAQTDAHSGEGAEVD